MDKIFTKLFIASGASLVVTENVNLQPLWTALITLAVSLVTVFTYEGVAWLKSWFKKKKAKNEAEEKEYHSKCEEADEVVQIADAEKKNKEE